MRAALSAPYADVRADELVLALDAPPAPALETLVLQLGGYRLELRLLGHSHQAVITAPGFALSETVSCEAEPTPGRGRLPGSRAVRRDGRAYAFSAEVTGLRDATPAALAETIGADPAGLVGFFDGDPAAFTAVRGAELPRAAGVRWETWHAYPQTDELVRTLSEVRAA